MERFTLQVISENIEYDRTSQSALHFPIFETVLRPLLKQSIACYIYGLKNEETKDALQEILVKDKGKHRLDLEKEVIHGFEWLWHGVYPERRSIVILMDPKKVELAPIFSHCLEVLVLDNPNATQTQGAIQFCRKQVEQGLMALCITQTNGFEWIDLFALEDYQLYEEALAYCNSETDLEESKAYKKRRKLPGIIQRSL